MSMIKQSLLLRNKILFLTGVPIDDAATLYRSGLVARKLKKEGYQIVFTSVSANFKKIEFRDVANLPVQFIGQAHYFAEKSFSKRKRLGLGKTLFENIRICCRFGRILHREKPERVLVVTALPTSLMVGLTSKILGFKTFIDIEDLVVGQMEAAGYPKFLVSLYGLVEKTWMRIFDKVAVCSHYLQKRYSGAILLPNMVEMSLWKKQRNKETKKQKNIVFVGQIGPYHGQMEALEALTPLLRKYKDLTLTFIGGGEMEEKLKIKSEKLKIKDQVILTGQVSQERARKILSTCQIGILPLWDTPVHQARHPLKLLEYLAAGLVVVTNNVGEVGRIIEDGENGILCPAGDMKCLAKKVGMILGNPDIAYKISKNAAASVQEFSSEKILPKWIRFLEQ